MFARKKKNKSGSISIQIVSKHLGRYRVEQTVGCSKDLGKVEELMVEAKNRINYPNKQDSLFTITSEADAVVKKFLNEVSNLQIHTIGPELIFGTLFDRIGFNTI